MRQAKANRAAASMQNWLDAAVGAAQQDDADGLEQEVWRPDQQMRKAVGPCIERLANENETVINCHENQCNGDAEGGFTAMSPDPQGNANEREANARKRKSGLAMYLDADRESQIFPLIQALGFWILDLCADAVFEPAEFVAQLEKRHISNFHVLVLPGGRRIRVRETHAAHRHRVMLAVLDVDVPGVLQIQVEDTICFVHGQVTGFGTRVAAHAALLVEVVD